MAVGYAAAVGPDRGYQTLDPDLVPERPKLSLDLMIDLSQEQRERLARHLRYEIDRYLQQTQARRGHCQQWRRDFELYPPGRSTRWQGSADVPAPLTHIYCQSHHTRLNQQIVHGDPPFSVVARKENAVDVSAWIEEALGAALAESEWDRFADEAHAELPVVGNVFARVTYEEEFIHAPQFQFDMDEDGFLAMTDAGIDPNEALHQALSQDEDGTPEVFLGWTDIKKFAGVRFKAIPFEDGIIVPTTVRDPKEARGIGERMLVKGVELVAGARSGRYWSDAVRQVLAHASSSTATTLIPDESRSERLEVQGLATDSGWGGDQDARYREYLIYELNWRDDWNNDGKEEWAILTYDYQSNTLLRAQYMPYEHGQAYYHLLRYFARPQELFGMAVAEKLACLQDAATAIINQILDHADLMLNLHGNFFFDASADFNPDKYQAQLGRPIQVGNVDGIKLIQLEPMPAQHYQAYQLIKDMCDLVTATSNPSLGRATDSDKTLGEIQIVSSASNMIFEEVASRVARDHARLWDQFRWLLAQFGDGGELKYRRTAAPGHVIDTGDGQLTPMAQVGGEMQPAPGGVAFGAIPSELLYSDVDLIPTGLAELSDYNARLQQATIVQNTLLMHPLTAQNNEALKVALDVFLQATGYRQREKIMNAVEQALQQMMLMQQMMAEQGVQPGQEGQGGQGGPPPEGGQPPPKSQPQMQGPAGQMGAQPSLTPSLTGNATAQGNLQPPAPISPGMQ